MSNGKKRRLSNLTPSKPGPQQGFLLRSNVSKQELYFCAKGRHRIEYLTQWEVKFTYQDLSDCNKALNIEFVITQVKDLEGPVSLENLGNVRDASLGKTVISPTSDSTNMATHADVIPFEIQCSECPEAG